jgi:hypothetical protein
MFDDPRPAEVKLQEIPLGGVEVRMWRTSPIHHQWQERDFPGLTRRREAVKVEEKLQKQHPVPLAFLANFIVHTAGAGS